MIKVTATDKYEGLEKDKTYEIAVIHAEGYELVGVPGSRIPKDKLQLVESSIPKDEDGMDIPLQPEIEALRPDSP
jgi:NADPH-dependent 7-cyano-7-deazaguanine reductase QueF-like protein